MNDFSWLHISAESTSICEQVSEIITNMGKQNFVFFQLWTQVPKMPPLGAPTPCEKYASEASSLYFQQCRLGVNESVSQSVSRSVSRSFSQSGTSFHEFSRNAPSKLGHYHRYTSGVSWAMSSRVHLVRLILGSKVSAGITPGEQPDI